MVKQFPNIKMVATTLREVHSTNRHDWAAVLWLDGQRYVSPTCQLDVLDRIGGGDGFAAGLIYGLIAGRKPEEALRLGWAHGAAADDLPRRRHDGPAGRGRGLRQGRLGPRAAVNETQASGCHQPCVHCPPVPRRSRWLAAERTRFGSIGRAGGLTMSEEGGFEEVEEFFTAAASFWRSSSTSARKAWISAA